MELFGSLTGGLMIIGTLSLLTLFCYILSLAILKFCLHRHLRAAMALCLALMLVLTANGVCRRGQEDLSEVTFINVGQGDCTLIQLPDGTNILIDAGGIPAYAGDYDVGGQIVLPYLRKAGIRHLDYAIATHGHDDHIRGFTSVLSAMPAQRVLFPKGFGQTDESKEFLSYIKEENIPGGTLTAGDVIEFSGDASLEVLMPSQAWLSRTEDENERSLVLRFHFGASSVLLMSDLGEDGERYLTEAGTDCKADIIKAGHHGAKDSTGVALLDLVKPRYIYIPCGDNQFGHPAPEMLDRCEERGVLVLRADEDKDVCFVLSKTGIRTIRKGGK